MLMVHASVSGGVEDLLDAVRNRPAELPLREVVGLSRQPVQVSVSRRGVDSIAYVTPRPDPRFDSLTKREYEVAMLVASGLSNSQLASMLFISVGTVKDHVHSILSKTDLASRSEVAACWYGAL